MRRRTVGLAAVLGFGLLAGCRNAQEAERDDARRLQAFLTESKAAYEDAVKLERRALEGIEAAAVEMTAASAATASERLRQRVLSPKHTYKSLHDRLNAWQLSGRAEVCRRRMVTHLKARETALLRFTTLLTAIRDSAAGGLPAEVEQLRPAVREHPTAGNEFEAIAAEARAITASGS